MRFRRTAGIKKYLTSMERRIRPFWRKYRVFWILLVIVAVGNTLSFAFRQEIAGLTSQMKPLIQSLWPAGADTESRPQAPKMKFEAKPLDPLTPAKPPFYKVSANLTFDPPYLVEASDRFSVQGRLVRLAYLQGLGATDLCLNSVGGKFPCGLMGRASLQNRISASTMTCLPVPYGIEDIRYDCRLSDGTRLAEHQLAAGFARPDAAGLKLFHVTSAQAKAVPTGAWNGGWQIQTMADLKALEVTVEQQRIEKDGEKPELETAE